ncbi:MAG TPA: pilus assembly protein [Myxococcota bacterium]|nr:pilus assembly protein [Myxococcota bacterium]
MRTRPTRGGAAALEFYLTLPIFLTMFASVIDFGWLFYQQSALDGAVHAACRTGATEDPGTGDALMSHVQAVTEDRIRTEMTRSSLECLSCVITVDDLYTIPARSLRCQVDNTFQPLIGVVPVSTLTARAIVRMEIQR